MAYIGSDPNRQVAKVDATDLAATVISAHSNIGAAPAETDELLLSDAGVLKAITVDKLLDPAGYTNIGATPAGADELLLSDAGVLKAVTVTNLMAAGGIDGWAANGGNNDLLPASASAGIYLGVSSATAANLLDDYEEGTWTPLMKDTSGNAMTSDTVEANYTKVGREVYIHVYIQTSSLGSASGGIRLYTLPFAATGAYNYGGCVCHYGDGLAITAGETINARTNGAVSYLRLQVWDASGGTTDMQASEWTADGQAMFTGSYIAG